MKKANETESPEEFEKSLQSLKWQRKICSEIVRYRYDSQVN